MVDEFQDTNRLQCELIDLLAAAPEPELFFVGDEFQSIYGFRHADVQVFRERRALRAVLPFTWNYRSRPEVLSVVNHLFTAISATASSPWRPPASSRPRLRPPVELLVTDKESYARTQACTGAAPRRRRSRGGCAS